MLLQFHLIILRTLLHYPLNRHHTNIFLFNAHHFCILIPCCLHLLTITVDFVVCYVMML